MLGFSFPVFVVGYLLIFVFSISLGCLPVQGYRALADGVGPFLRHLILPSLALGLRLHGADRAHHPGQRARGAVPRTTSAPRGPRGCRTRHLLFDHALPNAAVPIVTIIGVGVALLLGGVVVTESVFAIPGLGRLWSTPSCTATTR